MAFTELVDLDADTATAIGGRNKKTGKPNPTSIEGYYIGSRTMPNAKNPNKPSVLHIFKTADGNVGVWGKTNLDQKLSAVTHGTMTRVKFTGMKETKNNPMYCYSVAVDNENVIDVGAAGNSYDHGAEDTDDYVGEDTYGTVDEEELPPDELPPVAALPPKRAAPPPAANVNRVKQLLQQRKQSA